MTKKFYTQYDRPPKELKRTWESYFTDEELKECKVETAGYIPSAIRISRMIKTTENLELYRSLQIEKMKLAGYFDFVDGNIDLNYTDPTRSPGFDMADMGKVQEQLAQSIQRTKELVAIREAEKQEKIEKEKLAQANAKETIDSPTSKTVKNPTINPEKASQA